jgi:hypothetical protein
MSAPLFSARLLGATSMASTSARMIGMLVIWGVVAQLGANPLVESFLIASTYGNAYYAFQSSVIAPFLIARAGNSEESWGTWLRRVRALSMSLALAVAVVHVLFAPAIASVLSAGKVPPTLVTNIRWTGLFIMSLVVSAPARIILSMHGYNQTSALAPAFSWASLGIAIFFFPDQTAPYLVQIQSAVIMLEMVALFCLCRRVAPELGGILFHESGMAEVIRKSAPLITSFFVNLAVTTIDLCAAAWVVINGVSIYTTGTRVPFMFAFGLSAATASLVSTAVKVRPCGSLGASDRQSTLAAVRCFTLPVAIFCAALPVILRFCHFGWMEKLPNQVLLMMFIAAWSVPVIGWVSVQGLFFDIYNLQKHSCQINILGVAVRAAAVIPLGHVFGIYGVLGAVMLAQVTLGTMQRVLLRRHEAGRDMAATPFYLLQREVRRPFEQLLGRITA